MEVLEFFTINFNDDIFIPKQQITFLIINLDRYHGQEISLSINSITSIDRWIIPGYIFFCRSEIRVTSVKE